MDILKTISRRSFWVIVVFSLVLAGLLNAGVYYGSEWLTLRIAGLPESVRSMLEITRFLDQVAFVQENLLRYVIPGITGTFLLLAILLWLCVRASFENLVGGYMKEQEAGAKKKSKSGISKKEKEHNDRRMYLNLLSVLQREGRLMDFFSEDLTPFEDEQIGAAVRSIHENCKKSLDKHLQPAPVLEEAEGETVTVEEGFDPAAVKLTGNVTGEPPFEGVLRHRGWKVSRKALPVLAPSQDSTIIAPAEVEIE